MPRKPSINYWESRKAYGCWYKKRQHILAEGLDDAPTGSTYLKARQAFDALLGLGDVASSGDNNTVRVILEKYLEFVERRRSPGTLKIRLQHFKPFCDAGYGELLMRDLTPYLVYEFCERQKKPRTWGKGKGQTSQWEEGSVIIFLQSIRAAFRWAKKMQLISKNPVAEIEISSGRSRGREKVVSKEEHKTILALCNAHRRRHAFRDLVIALENTGARPGELAAATATSYREDIGALVYFAEHKRLDSEHRHKSAHRGKDRCIFFTGDALALLRRLVEKYPQGPLFRNTEGRQWTTDAIVFNFQVIQEATGITDISAYSYRHTFATRWLEADGSIEVLAELMGNTPATIRRHYSHLCGNPHSLRRKLERFRGRQESITAATSPAMVNSDGNTVRLNEGFPTAE